MRRTIIGLLVAAAAAMAGPIDGGACASGTLAEWLAIDNCTSVVGVRFSGVHYDGTQAPEDLLIGLTSDSGHQVTFELTGMVAPFDLDLGWTAEMPAGVKMFRVLTVNAVGLDVQQPYTMTANGQQITDVAGMAQLWYCDPDCGEADQFDVHVIADVGPGGRAALRVLGGYEDPPAFQEDPASSVPDGPTWAAVVSGLAALALAKRG